MSTAVQCPICQMETRILATDKVATCPNCGEKLSAAGKTAPTLHAAMAAKKGRKDTASEGARINPYGAFAVALAVLALFNASLVGVRVVTIVLVILGLLVVALGFVVGKAKRQSNGMLWFTLGGVLNGLVLFVVFFRPGWLNSFWGLDVDANEPNPKQLVVVPRKQPYSAGKLLTAEDWVDASKDAIRQSKVLVRIESVKSGSRGGITCLQLHLQIVNQGNEVLPIAGFGADKPVLTDSSGRSFAFLKPQKRIYSEGPPVFEDLVDQGVKLRVDGWQDYLLLFEMPPRVDHLKLQVPASAWGGEGHCKFDITASSGINP